MGKFTKTIILALAVCGATIVSAQEDESYTNYESIVNELKASADSEKPEPEVGDLDWNEVAMNGGMSLATSYISLRAPNGAVAAGLIKGFEAHFGANLFSKKSRAEFAFRNFAPEDLGNVYVDLKEFEGRIVFLPYLAERTVLRMGFGLTARYMDIDARTQGVSDHYEASTPASAMILGVERKISKAVSVGPDFAYRSALSDTFDKSAWDAAIRLNASF